MKEYKGKVAVITGAATGIGRGIAEHCAKENMKIVLADVENEALTKTEKEMKEAGAEVVAVMTDVSKASDVEVLAEKTLDTYGSVDLLFNNAGVHLIGTIWECTLKDWEWLLGVNLWGVIHGIRTFIPIMLEQGTEAYIVNTASSGGLTSAPFVGVYRASKHAVVTISESLQYELLSVGANIKVSILCPGLVKTDISTSKRNRPAELNNETHREIETSAETIERFQKTLASATGPEMIADQVFDALYEDKFYILTHPEETKYMVRNRMEGILSEQISTLRP